MPFLAFLAAGLVFPARWVGQGAGAVVLALGLSGLLMAGFVVAYYGKDHQFYFTPDEVEAAEYLYNNAPPGCSS